MSLKTNKTISKRVKLTKKGKVLKRKAGQDHFNGKESGKVRRNKRRDVNFPATIIKGLKAMLPFTK
jgi:large subunit ribosomal protein L35